MRKGLSVFISMLSLLLAVSCSKSEEGGNIFRPDIKIAILGDSISTFDGYMASDIEGYEGQPYSVFYPKGDVKKVKDTWWYKVTSMLGTDFDNLCNCSWGGSKVSGKSGSETSAIVGCSTKRIADLSAKGFAPDLVICYISCNDWNDNVPLGDWSRQDPVPQEGNKTTFREAYALMLHKIKEFYPQAIVVCLTNIEDLKRDKTPGWPSNNSSGVTVGEWNHSIREVADAMDCHVIDLQECGINYDNAASYTVDNGLHPNKAGMTLIAKKVSGDLKPIINYLSAQ